MRFGPDHPRRDLEQNTIVTWNVLEAMRAAGARRIAFSSTGSVYGEPEIFPTPETAPFPVQTSLYAASKLAAEGMIAAYVAAFGYQAFIFRFVSILGERYTHGHVFDFYRQLLEHPERLDVLGNGLQRKSYLYVQDCVSAILLAAERCTEAVNIFNLGTDEYCQVNDSIGWIGGHLGVDAGVAICGRRTRMGRRQPVHFPGLRAHAGAGLEAGADHPARDHPHAGIPAAEPVGAGGAQMKPLKTEVAFATPWFQVLGKTMREGEEPYYSLKLPDYAAVVALTEEQRVLIVRQYRPAVEHDTLELPSGMVDAGETPLEAARRELLEETGYEAGEWEVLGGMEPDTGRLGNRIWSLRGKGVRRAEGRAPEAGIEVLTWSLEELSQAMVDGRFDHALHVASVMMAVLKGRRESCRERRV